MKTKLLTTLAASSFATAVFAVQPYPADVVTVDAAKGKVTLKHGAIKKLDMSAMTMGYRVADPAMLQGIKMGDRVTFDIDGGYTVTKIEKAK